MATTGTAIAVTTTPGNVFSGSSSAVRIRNTGVSDLHVNIPVLHGGGFARIPVGESEYFAASGDQIGEINVKTLSGSTTMDFYSCVR